MASEFAGLLQLWSTTTIPSGFLMCDGTAISRTTFADLFAVIGVIYGDGDGSTTFNLPDYRGYFPRSFAGAGGSDPESIGRSDRGDGTTGNVVGTKQTGTIKTHVHSIANGAANLGNTVYPSVGSHAFANSAQAATNYSGGNESRPINVYVMPIIKY